MEEEARNRVNNLHFHKVFREFSVECLWTVKNSGSICHPEAPAVLVELSYPFQY